MNKLCFRQKPNYFVMLVESSKMSFWIFWINSKFVWRWIIRSRHYLSGDTLTWNSILFWWYSRITVEAMMSASLFADQMWVFQFVKQKVVFHFVCLIHWSHFHGHSLGDSFCLCRSAKANLQISTFCHYSIWKGDGAGRYFKSSLSCSEISHR